MDYRIITTQAEYNEAKNKVDNDIERLIIKDAKEIIYAHTDLEVRDNSVVVVSGVPHIAAYYNSTVFSIEYATIIANDKSTVHGFNKTSIIARDNSISYSYDNSTVNCSDNAQVFARGNSFITATQFSVVEDYDNSVITASGNSHITANNSVKIISNEKASVMARNKSVVEAFGDSLITAFNSSYVRARDNCLVIAADNTRIVAEKKSIVLSTNTFSNSIIGNCYWINENKNDVNTIKENIKNLLRLPLMDNDPIRAVKYLLQGASPENRESINKHLLSLGGKDEQSLKKVVSFWMTEKEKEVSHER